MGLLPTESTKEQRTSENQQKSFKSRLPLIAVRPSVPLNDEGQHVRPSPASPTRGSMHFTPPRHVLKRKGSEINELESSASRLTKRPHQLSENSAERPNPRGRSLHQGDQQSLRLPLNLNEQHPRQDQYDPQSLHPDPEVLGEQSPPRNRGRHGLFNQENDLNSSYHHLQDEHHDVQRRRSSSPCRVQSSQALVPDFILKKIHPDELRSIERQMTRWGFNDPGQWSLKDFSKHYLVYGSNDSIRRYCQATLDSLEIAVDLMKNKRTLNRSRSASYDSQDERRQRKQYHEREKRKAHAWHENEPWNQVDSQQRSRYDLFTIFPEIDDRAARQLLKDMPSFNDRVSDESKSDWCSWYSEIHNQLLIHSKLKANFILVNRAGAKFTNEIISGVNYGIRDMPTDILARRIGSVVYNKMGINPVEIAAKYVRKGRYGCTSYEDVYRRTVEMHHCRHDKISKETFVLELYHGLSFKLPIPDRVTFKQRVAMRYPSIDSIDQLNKGAQYYNESINTMMPHTLPFPETPNEIHAFSEFLVQEAVKKSPERAEQKYMHLCSNPDDRYFGTVIKKSTQNKRDFGSTVQAQPSPQPPIVQSSATSSHHTQSQSTPAPNQANAGNGNKQKGEKKWCEQCKSKTHNPETCWTLHPELKEPMKAELKARAKQSKAAKAKKNSGNSNNQTQKEGDKNYQVQGKNVQFDKNSTNAVVLTLVNECVLTDDAAKMEMKNEEGKDLHNEGMTATF